MTGKTSIWLIILIFVAGGFTFAQEVQFPSNKIGVYQFEFHGAKYELDDRTSSGDASNTLSGNVFFVERILLDVFAIGIKAGSGLKRTLEFNLGTNDIKVEETASYQALEFKTYGTKHWKEGFKPYLAVGYGMLTTTSTVSIESDAGAESEETTTATIPLKSWCIGFDYILWSIILRMEIGQTNGKRIDLESSTTYQAEYDYDTETAALAIGYIF
jgi:hypothetical protein